MLLHPSILYTLTGVLPAERAGQIDVATGFWSIWQSGKVEGKLLARREKRGKRVCGRGDSYRNQAVINRILSKQMSQSSDAEAERVLSFWSDERRAE